MDRSCSYLHLAIVANFLYGYKLPQCHSYAARICMITTININGEFKFGGLSAIRQIAKINTPSIILRIRYINLTNI